MKDYVVKVPIAGFVEISLEAKNDKEAQEKGYKLAIEAIGDFAIKKESVPIVNEWNVECFEKIVEGNFCWLSCTKIEVNDF
jgi:hypothetical protein